MRIALLAPAVLLAAGSWSCSNHVSAANEETAIRAFFERRRLALEAKDLPGVLSTFDRSGPLSVIFGNGTPMTDWASVERAYREWFAEAGTITITDSCVQVRVHPSGTTAWATYLTDETDVTKGTGTTEYLRATLGLEKHGQTWVVVQAHWSVPTGAQRQALRRAPSN